MDFLRENDIHRTYIDQLIDIEFIDDFFIRCILIILFYCIYLYEYFLVIEFRESEFSEYFRESYIASVSSFVDILDLHFVSEFLEFSFHDPRESFEIFLGQREIIKIQIFGKSRRVVNESNGGSSEKREMRSIFRGKNNIQYRVLEIFLENKLFKYFFFTRVKRGNIFQIYHAMNFRRRCAISITVFLPNILAYFMSFSWSIFSLRTASLRRNPSKSSVHFM